MRPAVPVGPGDLALSVIAVVVFPASLFGWALMAAYSLRHGRGALEAMEIGEAQAASVGSAEASSKQAVAA